MFRLFVRERFVSWRREWQYNQILHITDFAKSMFQPKFVTVRWRKNMLLSDKTALVYGAGGSIGGAAARVLANDGARVVLVGRAQASLDVTAHNNHLAGGKSETAVVDAFDPSAADAHLA